MAPEVSIICPFYNSEGFADRAIRTAVGQDFQDWEFLAVDDASRDRTAEVLSASGDDRVHCIRLEQNSGPAVARNVAIERARGRFIAFLDSDDYWHPEKLSRQLAFMRNHDYAFSYTCHRKVTEDLQPIRDFVPPKLLTRRVALRYNPLHTSAVIYDAEKLGTVLMPEIRKRQDYGMWLRLLSQTDGHLLPEVLSFYVQRSGSVSSGKAELLGYNWELYRRYEGMGFIPSAYYLAWDVFSKLARIK